jgi:2-phosphosulfolactate phosphatase
MTVDTVLTPAEIDLLPRTDLSRTTCVVFDVLRATSSIVTALAHGARSVHPVLTIEEALALRERMPDALLGGERGGDPIPGFDVGTSPAEYVAAAGRRVITTTTNGTVALRACAGAARVLAAALLNVDAVASDLRRSAPQHVVIVGAGTFREAALEDVLAAGVLLHALDADAMNDASRAALAVHAATGGDLMSALRQSRNGRALAAQGRGDDVAWCARRSVWDVVPTMGADGAIRSR